MDKLRVSLASFAHMHMFSYASAISSRADSVIDSVWDADAERGREMASAFDADFEPNLDTMLARQTDAVIVCTENVFHREVAVAASKAGKHVLCEKPLCTKYDDGLAMIEAAEKAGRVLATAFPCRFSPAVLRLRDQVMSGALGEIIGIAATNHGCCPMGWFVELDKSGGGAVADHTVHVADLLRWLLNSDIKTVYAEAGNLMYRRDFDDIGIVTAEFENGVFATIDCSWSRPKSFPFWGDVTMEVTGTKGAASLDMFNQKFVMHTDSDMRTRYNAFCDNLDEALVGAFLSACRGCWPDTLATGWDGLKSAEAFMGAYASVSKAAAVSLPLSIVSS